MTNDKVEKETEAPAAKRRLPASLRWLLVAAALVAVAVAGWFLVIEVALWRGAANIELRNHERAIAWLKQAERMAPDRAEAHFLLARCYRRQEEFQKVRHHLQRAHQLGWDPSQLEREQWIALAQTGQYEDVADHWAELFEDVGSDGPEISKAYTTLCLARFQFREADQVLDAWEKDFPEDAQPHVMRGRLSGTNLNWAGAKEHYRKALRLDPHRNDARLGLAQALINLGQVQQAEEILGVLVKQQPENWAARLALAQCQHKLDQHTAARRQLDKVLAADPDNVDALLEAGNLELAQNDHQAAARYLKKAVKLKPENREVAYAAARTLQAAGDHAQASKLFKFVDEATEPLIRLKKLVSQLLAEPDNLEVRFQVALITWRYKSREEGAQWLMSLLNFDPHHQPTHAALAQHFQMLGDQQRAAYHLARAGIAPGEAPPREPPLSDDSQPDESQSDRPQPGDSSDKASTGGRNQAAPAARVTP